jgi:hypothetical protein
MTQLAQKRVTEDLYVKKFLEIDNVEFCNFLIRFHLIQSWTCN